MVAFANEKRYVGLFADYGTGKTLTALSIMDQLRLRRVLVVSSKTSIQGTWPEEIRKHSNFRFFSIVGTKDQKLRLLNRAVRSTWIDASYYHGERSDTVIFLLNFEGVKNIFQELCQVRFDAIIVDESTKIKDPRTQRTKYLWTLGQTARRRYIMTGFPITEGLHEIYAQIKFLDNGRALGNKYYAFLNRHFVKQGNLMCPKRGSVKEIADAISPFCIRITNKDLNLPPQVYKVIELEKTAQQTKIIKELHELFMVEFGKVKIDIEYIFALIAKEMQICDGLIWDKDKNLEVIDTHKDDALASIIEEIDVRKNKLVVWVYHQLTVEKLERMLSRLLKPFRVHVVTLYADQHAQHPINKFQYTDNHNILIASLKKASESITLTAARYALYYSHWWSNDLRMNSEARIRRKGSEQHASIIYTDFLTKGSIERQVYACMRRKGSLVKTLKEQFSKMGERAV